MLCWTATTLYQPPKPDLAGRNVPRAAKSLPVGTVLTADLLTLAPEHPQPPGAVVGQRLLVSVPSGGLITDSMVSDVPHGLQPGEALISVPISASEAGLARPGAVVQLIHSTRQNAIPRSTASQSTNTPLSDVVAARAVIVSACEPATNSGPSWAKGSSNGTEVLVKTSVTVAQKIVTTAEKSSIRVIFVT